MVMRDERQRILDRNLVSLRSSDRWSRRAYRLPVPKDRIVRIVSSSVSHVGHLRNAIDFLVPEGTPVYAAAEGVVTALKDDSNVGGRDPQFWYEGNYVVVRHEGESTSYEHLRYRGVVVRVDERVQEGQLIGYSGNTGYSRGPHLHFEVMEFYGPGDEEYVTLKARFTDAPNAYAGLDR
jgi:murein DD-endopeptidase MepM/ murein hydrolase activator NlpD